MPLTTLCLPARLLNLVQTNCLKALGSMLPFHTTVFAAVRPVHNSLVDSPYDVQKRQAETRTLSEFGREPLLPFLQVSTRRWDILRVFPERCAMTSVKIPRTIIAMA
jgi:hypothetical protein